VKKKAVERVVNERWSTSGAAHAIERELQIDVTQRTVERWVKKKDQFLNMAEESMTKKASHMSKYDAINKLVHELLMEFERRGGRVEDKVIRGCACKAAQRLGYKGFEKGPSSPEELEEHTEAHVGMT